ncbi:STAS domain-containing protein [Celeribacter baekdonensis]|uniref:Anti-sigma factor antagonist n=1 Tax=Celeribacter baekdonensis TaxID=875171 RepID=A0A2R4M6P6_9RHOB|nr:STAS domain-containing protein [Celeribacter baekdonensis]AVW92759.1 anti-sigma factor antagonist [Celeribacter baekdonensis]|tara:strand:- start:80682 stop:81026 length:345 start_codon:yes stop_codon:yes gene_type:complete
MKLNHQDFEDVRVVCVGENRIDAACAIQFKDEMRELSEAGPSRIILDLGNVEFLDSSGLGAVVAALKAVRHGQRLELAALHPTVQRVFHLTRMDTVFTIHDSVSTAVEGVANAS